MLGETRKQSTSDNNGQVDHLANVAPTSGSVDPVATTSVSHDLNENAFLYKLNDVPPWYICILSGFQHFLLTFTSTLPLPNMIADVMCVPPTHPVRSFLLATIMFGCGFATYLQTTFGIRLPIVQGFTFSFYVATSAILRLPQWRCPPINVTLAAESPEFYDEVWQPRMREIQGAIISSTLIVAILCATGVVGLLIRFVTPLTILATNTLIGLSAMDSTIEMSSKNWALAAISLFLIVLFSQYLKDIHVPFPGYSREEGCRVVRYPLFSVFPILLALGIMWIVCYVMTITDYLPPGDPSRTDAKQSILDNAPWFRVPYPCQWGTPTFSISSTIGMMAGVIAVSIEVVGNYQVCANLIGLPTPPIHAVSRGLFFEAIGCIIMGLLGAGNGTTTHSENMGAISLTGVASRRVIQAAAAAMILISIITKFSALFTIVPPPIMGAIYAVEFGMVIGIGINNVHSVNLFTSRNLFIIGMSLFLGLMLPSAVIHNPDAVKTGSDVIDQFLTVLLSTGMLIGGITGAILDNTIPGTASEKRHLKRSRVEQYHPCYDLPFGMGCIQRSKFTKYIAICPTFKPPAIYFECPCCRPCRIRSQESPQRSYDSGAEESAVELKKVQISQYDNEGFVSDVEIGEGHQPSVQ